MTTVLPEIPPETLAEWQRVVDLTARLARVPASLIMQRQHDYLRKCLTRHTFT